MEAKPENEQQRQPEVIAEKKVYNFEEGVEQITERMRSLLLQQDYVVLAIAGPWPNDTNIGKTTLVGNLGRTCIREDIPYIEASDETTLSIRYKNYPGIKRMDRGVIILGAMSSPIFEADEEQIAQDKSSDDLKVKKAANSIGLPISKIDLRIFITRPDRPPIRKVDSMWSDVIINNEHAIDDPYKYR